MDYATQILTTMLQSQSGQGTQQNPFGGQSPYNTSGYAVSGWNGYQPMPSAPTSTSSGNGVTGGGTNISKEANVYNPQFSYTIQGGNGFSLPPTLGMPKLSDSWGSPAAVANNTTNNSNNANLANVVRMMLGTSAAAPSAASAPAPSYTQPQTASWPAASGGENGMGQAGSNYSPYGDMANYTANTGSDGSTYYTYNPQSSPTPMQQQMDAQYALAQTGGEQGAFFKMDPQYLNYFRQNPQSLFSDVQRNWLQMAPQQTQPYGQPPPNLATMSADAAKQWRQNNMGMPDYNSSGYSQWYKNYGDIAGDTDKLNQWWQQQQPQRPQTPQVNTGDQYYQWQQQQGGQSFQAPQGSGYVSGVRNPTVQPGQDYRMGAQQAHTYSSGSPWA